MHRPGTLVKVNPNKLLNGGGMKFEKYLNMVGEIIECDDVEHTDNCVSKIYFHQIQLYEDIYFYRLTVLHAVMWLMNKTILEEMWDRKEHHKEVFATGVLNRDARAVEHTITRYNGKVTSKERTIKTGTQVIITMISRFGDVGIRDYDINTAAHGYISRVDPDAIDDVRFLPHS